MLSLHKLSGSSIADVERISKYPDENAKDQKEKAEDYYQESEKTASWWYGSGAEALGLNGPVKQKDHMQTLQGFDPKTGEALVQTAGAERRYGWDMTFSSPKSVGDVWARLPDMREKIQDARRTALRQTLDYAQDHLIVSRRGSSSNRTITEEKAQAIFAAFEHFTSREQDPQPHFHVILQNMAEREDGTWGTLEPNQIYAFKKALGAIYRSEEAKGMQKIGFAVERDGESYRIIGVPREVEVATSKRRGQIETALEEKGLSGAKASDIATLDTRRGKKKLDQSVLEGMWEKEFDVLGWTPEKALELFKQKTLEQESFRRQEIASRLTAMEAVFQKADVVMHIAQEGQTRSWGRNEIEQEVDSFLRDPEIVKLRGQNGKTYYSTNEMLSLEKGILARATEGKEDRSHALNPETVQSAMSRFEKEKGFKLSDEQKSSIAHMTQDPGLIKVVQGHAGAGKSTALTPVRYAFEAEGREVIGAALQGKTAKGLEESTGIKSQTIASLLRELEGYDREDGTRADPTRKLSSKSVVIIDEAAMVDTRTMSRLQSLTHESGAKLELIGDERQVPPVAAGSPFRSLKNNLGFAELTETRRQSGWQKIASEEIRAGKLVEALTRYAKAGMITIAKDRDESMNMTVAKWSQDFDPEAAGASLLTAFRKIDVSELNARARETMKENGLLEGIRAEVQTSTGIKEFQAGDRIFFSRNNKTMGVMNGETGTLKEIAQDSNGTWFFQVQMDSSGRNLSFDPQKYEHFQHGYAITINKSQGETVEKTYNLGGGAGLEHLYVQMTRHKAEAHLVMTEDQINRIAESAGVDLPPTEKMIGYAESLAEKHKLSIPEGMAQDFDLCREFLNAHASKKLEERESFDFGLERVESLINSLSQSREKMNALDFEVEEEVTNPGKEEETEIEEVHRDRESPGPEREIGKEEGIRIPDRTIERERVLELEL